jgi:hypothetical protein
MIANLGQISHKATRWCGNLARTLVADRDYVDYSAPIQLRSR